MDVIARRVLTSVSSETLTIAKHPLGEAICFWTLAKLHPDVKADCFVARLFFQKSLSSSQ